MTRENIIDAITVLAQEAFSDCSLTFDEKLDAGNVEGWTSLSFMNLLTMIEVKYGFKFKIMELVKIQNLGQLVDAVMKHCENA